jgi:hypothetical protein
MEKIRLAIQKAEIKVKTLSESDKEQLTKTLNLTPREFASYQEIKSIAQAEGKIDLETAMFIYNSLGNWSRTDLATKVILTQVFAMFLGLNR